MKNGKTTKVILTTAACSVVLPPLNAFASEITVQPGDTLYRIAKKYQVPVEQLKQVNQLQTDLIVAGQQLKIPSSNPPEQEASDQPVVYHIANSSTYTVQPGDTLWKISQKFQTSVDTIKQLNQLQSDLIFVGQTLKVTQVSGQQTVKQSPSNQTKPVQSTPQASNKVGGSYVVQPGDTLWKISKQYAMDVEQLKQLNGLTSNTIYAGMKLKTNQSNDANMPVTAPAAPVQQNKPQSNGNQSNVSTYVVQAGDTLFGISNRFNISVETLKALNPSLNNNIVYIGQRLNIVGHVNQPATTAAVSNIISSAKNYIGVPYVWGGTSTSGFDCSGFIQYVYKSQNIKLPRTVAEMWNVGKAVSEPKIGDCVFFQTYKDGPSHLGIYLGNQQFIHADSTKGVTISSLTNPYWRSHYIGAKQLY